jgi:hypothetical protein
MLALWRAVGAEKWSRLLPWEALGTGLLCLGVMQLAGGLNLIEKSVDKNTFYSLTIAGFIAIICVALTAVFSTDLRLALRRGRG